jgi:hypothetical protein
MPVKCVTCGLLYRTGSELDWHVREEHTSPTVRPKAPPAETAATPASRPTPVATATPAT